MNNETTKEKLPSGSLIKYGFTDPASSRGKIKKTRARQAIVIIGVDHLMRIFTLLAWAGRLKTSKYLDKIIDTCDEYNPRIFGIEANAMQSLFADLVRDAGKKRLARMPIRSVHQPSRIDKNFRIRTALEPVISTGRLFTMENQIELESELRGFPTAATKDLVDCLASAIELVPKRPLRQVKNENAEKLAKYLRNTGMPSHLIEQRVEELYGKGKMSRRSM
jgi:hypothetical protein